MTTPNGEPGWRAVFYDHDGQGEPRNPIASYILKYVFNRSAVHSLSNTVLWMITAIPVSS